MRKHLTKKIILCINSTFAQNEVIDIDTSVETLKDNPQGALDESQFMGKPGDPIHIFKSFDLMNKAYDPTLNDYFIKSAQARMQAQQSNNNTEV